MSRSSKAAVASSTSSAKQPSQNKSGVPPPEYLGALPCEDLRDAHIFYAVGDIGDYNANAGLAEAMEAFARKTRPPDFIWCMGDNFYPHAATTKEEAKNDFHSWRARFIWGALQNCVWKVCLGNHDVVQGDASFQLNYTNDPENPRGLWQMRGNDPNEKPSSVYEFSFPVYAPGKMAPAAATTTTTTTTTVKTASEDEEKVTTNNLVLVVVLRLLLLRLFLQRKPSLLAT